MKRAASFSVGALAAFAASATAVHAAEPVCSAEYERVGAGEYEWRGTILADDGKIYDFAIASITEAGNIAAIANGEGGALGAYEALLAMATERATVADGDAIADVRAHIAAAYDADVTTTEGGTGAGTWSILCFMAVDPAAPLTDPILIERRGDSTGVNPAADQLRAILIALDPAFAVEKEAGTPAP